LEKAIIQIILFCNIIIVGGFGGERNLELCAGAEVPAYFAVAAPAKTPGDKIMKNDFIFQ
jgi:hypothetical protein